MSSALDDGAVFANRYRIVRCMARGGMGAVYEVVHLDTERRRALKVMHAHILESEDSRERFKREAVIAAQIESEFIVDVFDAGVDPATSMPFLCMELLRGEELSRRIRRLQRLPPHEVALFLHQTALALDRTHAAAVVHRDLKPENLFVTEQEDGPPRIKVLDFGIAKVVSEGANSGTATLSMGTPLYMSPEQFELGRPLTGASDVYALGLIAYTCLVGVSYWAEEAKAGGIFAFGAVAAKGPSERASERARRRGVHLSAEFDAWFARTTAVEPEHRFARATDATRALAQALGVSTGGERRATADAGDVEIAAPDAAIPPVGEPPPKLPASWASPSTFTGSALISANTPPPTIRELDDAGPNEEATLFYKTPSSKPSAAASARGAASVGISPPSPSWSSNTPAGPPSAPGSLTPAALTPAGAALPQPFAPPPPPWRAADRADLNPGLQRRRVPAVIAVAAGIVVAVAVGAVAVFTGARPHAASAPSVSAVPASAPAPAAETLQVPPSVSAVASAEPIPAESSSRAPSAAPSSPGKASRPAATPRAADPPRGGAAPRGAVPKKYTQD